MSKYVIKNCDDVNINLNIFCFDLYIFLDIPHKRAHPAKLLLMVIYLNFNSNVWSFLMNIFK